MHGPVHDDVFCPVVLPKKPAAHSPEQLALACPVVFPNNPTGQLEHDVAFPRLYWPAGHAKAVAEVEPGGQNDPAAQGPLHSGVSKLEVLPYRPPMQGPVQFDVDRALLLP